jgi:hypothetical protein
MCRHYRQWMIQPQWQRSSQQFRDFRLLLVYILVNCYQLIIYIISASQTHTRKKKNKRKHKAITLLVPLTCTVWRACLPSGNAPGANCPKQSAGRCFKCRNSNTNDLNVKLRRFPRMVLLHMIQNNWQFYRKLKKYIHVFIWMNMSLLML